MSSASPARACRSRHTIAALTAAVMLLSGCASPFHFSPRLDTRLPSDNGAEAASRARLAGDLDLSLMALMDQRRRLWLAAGETEQMKTLTAMGLIGLGSVGLYRGLQGEQSRSWLTRAGLLASATYAGASWLEPNARQRIYLEGAKSLTCLALATAPYEMPLDEYRQIRQDIAKGRVALENLATTLRLVGSYQTHDDTWWLVRGAWNKLRWANRVLDSADAAIGNIEQAGPRLRDMTALLASDVAAQVNRVSKDLSELPAALSTLKPNANLLMGSEVIPPPDQDKVDSNPPPGSEAAPDAKPAEGQDAQCGPVAVAAPAAGADAATPKRPDQSGNSARAVERARPRERQDRQDHQALSDRLAKVMSDLDGHLGPVTSFVRRIAAARKGMDLPPACGGSSTVSLVPGRRDIVLQPGETFQFVLQGDNGKASAEFLGTALPHDVLDLSMPLTQSSTAVRLTAGKRIPKAINTVVRISDSRGQEKFDIAIKLCSSGSP